MHAPHTAQLQPDAATRLATLLGQPTGWGYFFEVPPVPHNVWTTRDWLRHIGDHWYRKPMSFKEPLPVPRRSL